MIKIQNNTVLVWKRYNLDSRNQHNFSHIWKIKEKAESREFLSVVT